MAEEYDRKCAAALAHFSGSLESLNKTEDEVSTEKLVEVFHESLDYGTVDSEILRIE